MDFAGQKLAEHLGLWVLGVAAALSFLIGYAWQSFPVMAEVLTAACCVLVLHPTPGQGCECVCMQVFAGGCVLAAGICIPDWPVFNRHQQQWLPHSGRPPPASSGSAFDISSLLGLRTTSKQCASGACCIMIVAWRLPASVVLACAGADVGSPCTFKQPGWLDWCNSQSCLWGSCFIKSPEGLVCCPAACQVLSATNAKLMLASGLLGGRLCIHAHMCGRLDLQSTVTKLALSSQLAAGRSAHGHVRLQKASTAS